MDEHVKDVMLIKDWINAGVVLFSAFAVIIAVFIANNINKKEQNRNGKLNIFKTLMMTRMNKLSQEHVAALNAIEIEFYEHKDAIEAWSKYFENLSTESPPEKRNRLFAKLVAQIGKALNMKIEQLDILNENYLPQGWVSDLEEQRAVRQMLLSLFKGHICLPVHLQKSMQLDDILVEINDEYIKNTKLKDGQKSTEEKKS